MDHYPMSLVGETVIGSRFETLYGGKGANQVRDSWRAGKTSILFSQARFAARAN